MASVESDCNCRIMDDDGRANESMRMDELNRKVCGRLVRDGVFVLVACHYGRRKLLL